MGQLQSSNQMIVQASVSRVWQIITDINLLPKVAPGVIQAEGSMNHTGEIRTIELQNRGTVRKTTERLIDRIPEKLLVWQLESDTQLLTSHFKDVLFSFFLQKAGEFKTNVVCEICYTPATHLAEILNIIAVRKMEMRKQAAILSNIKRLAESNS